jgi:hypothetical protein
MQTAERVARSGELAAHNPGASEGALEFYRRVLATLTESGVPFVVGGAFALAHYTGIRRDTKDLDVFVRPDDAGRVLATLAAAGYRTEMTAPHWLGKAFFGDAFVDVIFSSGNGVAVVDDQWLEFADEGLVLDRPAPISPVEEMIWSKAFVLERERFDGADVAHLIRARGQGLDWRRLFMRFDPHWQVLFSHLLLYRFAYPSERQAVPRWVLRGLLGRMQRELEGELPQRRVCQGTLLSARQYLVDVEQWGFDDARLDPEVNMTAEDIELLTTSLRAEEACGKRNAETGRRR